MNCTNLGKEKNVQKETVTSQNQKITFYIYFK